jgi:hypothetical protein
LRSVASAHTSQNVHSYVQIIASVAFGGNDLPHPSQDGLSSSIAMNSALGREVRAHLTCEPVYAATEA